jgi:hypothetical protein
MKLRGSLNGKAQSPTAQRLGLIPWFDSGIAHQILTDSPDTRTARTTQPFQLRCKPVSAWIHPPLALAR